MIGSEGAALTLMKGKKLDQRFFAKSPTATDIQYIRDLLNRYPGVPVQIINDTMDQSYVQQSLPAVSALNIGKLVKKRLERDFSETDLKQAMPLGRTSRGRKDWNYMFISTPMAPPLSTWIEFINSFPNRILGIYLYPIETTNFIKALDKEIHGKKKKVKEVKVKEEKKEPLAAPVKQEPVAEELEIKSDPEVAAPNIELEDFHDTPLEEGAEGEEPVEEPVVAEPAKWQLLVTDNKVSGYRQVVLKNDKIIFTRLIQHTKEHRADVIAGMIEQEILNTIEYLRRLSFTEDSVLDVFIILRAEIKQSLEASNLNATSVTIITPNETADLLKIENAAQETDRFVDTLFSAFFSIKNRPTLSFQPPEVAQYNQYFKVHKYAFYATCFLIPVILAYTGYLGYQVYQLKENVTISTKEKMTLEKRWQVAKDSEFAQYEELSSIDDTERINNVVKLYKLLAGGTELSPLPIISDFGSIKGTNVLVKSIDWSLHEAQTTNNNRGKPPKEEFEVKFDVDFYNEGKGFEELFENFDFFVKRLENKFEAYDIQLSRLPERITFQESTDSIPVQISIRTKR